MDIELTFGDRLISFLENTDINFLLMLIAFVVTVIGSVWARGRGEKTPANANGGWAKVLKDDLRHTEDRIIDNVKSMLAAFREEMKGLLTEHDKGNQRDFEKTYRQFDEIKRDIKELRDK